MHLQPVNNAPIAHCILNVATIMRNASTSRLNAAANLARCHHYLGRKCRNNHAQYLYNLGSMPLQTLHDVSTI